jgi:hypothetical protein
MKQLALFGGYAMAEVPSGVNVKQSYRKAGDKWKGEVDKAGFALVDGKRIETRCQIGLLPLQSEDGPSLAKVTGKKGMELKMEAAIIRKQLLTEGFAQFSGMVSSGDFTYNRMTVNKATGEVCLSIKPAAMKVVKQELTNDELLAEAKKRGLVK